ncbi:hypothetical protein Tco_0478529 [Tanacetum coccineum]
MLVVQARHGTRAPTSERSLHNFNIIEWDPFPLFWVRHVWRGQRSLHSFSDLKRYKKSIWLLNLYFCVWGVMEVGAVGAAEVATKKLQKWETAQVRY